MIKIGVTLLILIVTIGSISAIRINEMEINPPEGKNGIEWIELYNEENVEIDLSGWKIYDGLKSTKKRFTFTEGSTISPKGFYIVEFSSPVLNNGGDFVILYNSNDTYIDETPELKETASGTETWKLCGEEWKQGQPTKNEENECEEAQEKVKEVVEDPPENPKPIESVDEQTQNDEKEKKDNKNAEESKEITISDPPPISSPVVEQETKKSEIIKLNSQTIKTPDDNKNPAGINKGIYFTYGFAALSAVIGILLILRRNKINKNEFE